MPQIHFVSFATPSFRPRQWLLECSARRLGKADVIHTWSPARLEQDGFLARHADLFPGSKGFGWYAWKPHIIHLTLAAANDGDLVIYQDVGRREMNLIQHDLCFWNDYLDRRNTDFIPGVAIPWWGPNRRWTKRLVFERFSLTDDIYWNTPQIQASWSVWRNTESSRAFSKEWAESCRELDLVGGHLPNGSVAEDPDFIEHRWDQSLLTLLTCKHKINPLNDIKEAEPGFHEKSIDAWMVRLGAIGSSGAQARILECAAIVYEPLECLLKLIRPSLSKSQNATRD